MLHELMLNIKTERWVSWSLGESAVSMVCRLMFVERVPHPNKLLLPTTIRAPFAALPSCLNHSRQTAPMTHSELRVVLEDLFSLQDGR